jgi:hypothetical protein
MLREILCTLQNKLGKYHYINNGGCGIVAERMYTRLVELGYQPRILGVRSHYHEAVHLDAMREVLNCNGQDSNRAYNWTDECGNIISFNHVILHINDDGEDVYFDGTDFLEVDEDGDVTGYGTMYMGELLIRELRSFLKVEGLWNYTFENEHSAKGIRRVITQTLRQYEAA